MPVLESVAGRYAQRGGRYAQRGEPGLTPNDLLEIQKENPGMFRRKGTIQFG